MGGELATAAAGIATFGAARATASLGVALLAAVLSDDG